MTPREFDFFMGIVEHVAKEAYGLGHADGMAGKPLKDKGFSPSKATRLRLKTEMKKHAERR